jgi:hypothetical protein
MAKKLTGKALEKFEAERDVWQEVLDGVREIKAGGGKRTKVERAATGAAPTSCILEASRAKRSTRQ